jgi:hypothetical protein
VIDPILREERLHTPREDLYRRSPDRQLVRRKALTVVLTNSFGYLPSQVTFIRIRTCSAFRRCFFEVRIGFRQTPANREAMALVLPRAGVFVIFYAEQWDNDVPSTS